MTWKFQNYINQEDVGKEKGLIDPCAFRSVAIHSLNPESPIEEVWIVDEKLSLEEIAAFFKNPQTNSHVELGQAMWELWKNNLIRRADREKQVNAFNYENYTFAEIGLDRKVFVIYAPPYYLVKLTEEVWN